MSSLLHRINEDSLLYALRSFLTNDDVGPRDYMNLACASKHARAFVDEHWQLLKPDTGAGHRARFLRELEEHHRQRLERDLAHFPELDNMRQLVLAETARAPEWTPQPSSLLSAPPKQFELNLVAYTPTPLPQCAPGQVITSIRLLRPPANDVSVSLMTPDGNIPVHVSGDMFPLFADDVDPNTMELMQFFQHLPQTPLGLQLIVNQVDAVVVVAVTDAPREQQQQQQQWWVRSFYGWDHAFSGTTLDGASSIIIQVPHGGVAECILFHLIDDAEANATTRTANVVPSSFTLELNGHRFTIPAWPCRLPKKGTSGSGGGGSSESLRYYYRIPIEKRLNLSKIDNITLYAHFYPRPAVVRRVGEVRFQVGVLGVRIRADKS